MIFFKKSSLILIITHLNIVSLFLCLFLRLSLYIRLSEILLWYLLVWVSLQSSCLGFLNLWMMSLISFGKFKAILFLNIASATYSLLLRKEINACLLFSMYYLCLLLCLWCITFIYLSILYSVVSFDLLPQLTDSFLVVANQLLYLSTEFSVFLESLALKFLFHSFSKM